jgi:hypothetical protein
MFPDALDVFKTTLVILRRFKIFFILFFYAAATATFGYRALMFFLILMVPAIFAYLKDKEREAQGMDNFTGTRLFFRYGDEVHHISFSIPVSTDWSLEETDRFAGRLREDLSRRVSSRIPTTLAQADLLTIADEQTRETKDFLRILVRSRFGSLLAHFVHYASYGQTITAHYFTFIRGIQTDWAVVRFVIESPFTIWFWGIPWLLNKNSIIADISRFRSSSFDGIDILTMYNLTQYVLLCETQAALEEAGLLTEEIKQIILNQFNNTQNINAAGSFGASFGNIGQNVNQSLPTMQKAS